MHSVAALLANSHFCRRAAFVSSFSQVYLALNCHIRWGARLSCPEEEREREAKEEMLWSHCRDETGWMRRSICCVW